LGSIDRAVCALSDKAQGPRRTRGSNREGADAIQRGLTIQRTRTLSSVHPLVQRCLFFFLLYLKFPPAVLLELSRAIPVFFILDFPPCFLSPTLSLSLSLSYCISYRYVSLLMELV
jgi:hypothetical protein